MYPSAPRPEHPSSPITGGHPARWCVAPCGREAPASRPASLSAARPFAWRGRGQAACRVGPWAPGGRRPWVVCSCGREVMHVLLADRSLPPALPLPQGCLVRHHPRLVQAHPARLAMLVGHRAPGRGWRTAAMCMGMTEFTQPSVGASDGVCPLYKEAQRPPPLPGAPCCQQGMGTCRGALREAVSARWPPPIRYGMHPCVEEPEGKGRKGHASRSPGCPYPPGAVPAFHMSLVHAHQWHLHFHACANGKIDVAETGATTVLLLYQFQAPTCYGGPKARSLDGFRSGHG